MPSPDRVPQFDGWTHVGWWSDGNGWTPKSPGEKARTVRFMYGRGDEPIYRRPSGEASLPNSALMGWIQDVRAKFPPGRRQEYWRGVSDCLADLKDWAHVNDARQSDA